MIAPVPANEADRLKTLHRYNLLDTAPEEAFDNLTLLAAHVCDTPIALISFINVDRQWFKAKVGLTIPEIPRNVSFCAHAILKPDDVLIVPDATTDERFAINPLVTTDPKIRFYAGASLVTDDGYALGTLCVIDYKPRELTAQQLAALKTLRQAVITEIQLRRNVEKLSQALLERDQAQAALQKTKDGLEITAQRRMLELQNVNKQLNLELTEHKRTEENLQNSLQQLEMAYEQAKIYARELIAEIGERKQVEQALEEERALLAQRVAERTAELSAANAELSRAARAKDEFLASMSHELRTPLNAILGLTEALQEQTRGPLNERQLKSLHTIEESGRHLLSLINDILDLSKIEAGKLEFQLDLISVEAVCQASLQFVKEAAIKKKIGISFTMDNPQTSMRVDVRRLKQILVNLLNNAVKFTLEGGQIGLTVTSEAEQEVIRFTVWDTGIGIAPEDLARLFKPFVQVDSSLSRQHEGTGLGLALVTRLVELHGGSVAVESEPGRGSRFVVSLPWQESLELLEKPEPTEASLDTFNFRRILVIEDSATVIEQITRYLQELNIEIVAHIQGEDAVDKALEVQPDLILLDLQLPNLSGWQILTQLKADSRSANIPVIIISVVDERLRGLALGAAEYLVKPISRQQLRQMLGRVARQQADIHPVLANLLASKPRAEQSLILLAEDNEANIQLLAGYLTDEGYRVVVARNGQEAIDRAREKRPALILMDIQMPGMDGLEAMRHIRADTELVNIPIIALTALAMPDDRERCLAAGANDYMSKPVSLKSLIGTIEAYLEPATGDKVAKAPTSI